MECKIKCSALSFPSSQRPSRQHLHLHNQWGYWNLKKQNGFSSLNLWEILTLEFTCEYPSCGNWVSNSMEVFLNLNISSTPNYPVIPTLNKTTTKIIKVLSTVHFLTAYKGEHPSTLFLLKWVELQVLNPADHFFQLPSCYKIFSTACQTCLLFIESQQDHAWHQLRDQPIEIT